MDKEAKQENPSLLPTSCSNNNNNNRSNSKEESRRKAVGVGCGGCSSSSDRVVKRDEWSEGAVTSLIEAYEAKWILRNRAKLKGHDWEDVANYVSSRSNSTKSPKTQTQCKNKIESMKKRYRSESVTATADASSSSWPLFPRLHLLLRGSALPPPPPPHPLSPTANPPLMLLEHPLPPPAPPLQSPPPEAPASALLQVQVQVAPLHDLGVAQNSRGSNGVDRETKEEDGTNAKLSDHLSDKNAIETDSSTPALYCDKERLRSKNVKTRSIENKRRRNKEDVDVAESIRWLGEIVVRSEKARMDTMREVEKMRADAEAKRGEIDLKRTQLITNTQLEIAKLFAGITKGVDPSLRIGRS